MKRLFTASALALAVALPPSVALAQSGTNQSGSNQSETNNPVSARYVAPELGTITSPASSGSATETKNVSGATANLAPPSQPGDWPMQTRDWAGTRYSPLDQINTKNVGRLKFAWSFSDGSIYGHEGAPLVIGSTMYLVSPFPNIAYALDLSKPGQPIIWSYDPLPTPMAKGKACCGPVIRGWVYANGKLIYNLLDGHTIALDAKTGKEVWRIKMVNVQNGATMTMSPFVVKNKVLVGNSGGEFGKIGFIAALDVDTGKEIWRAYSTGPDAIVKIGPDFHPYYARFKGQDLGVKSWPVDMWKHGGGTVWGWITYDPKLNLIYYGTSNPGPRVPAMRPGMNLWTATIFARDADTGMAKWAYQTTPHDQWDYDSTQEMMLLDAPINGKMRHLLVNPNKNSFAYTIDRETGEVLVAAPFTDMNWATGFTKDAVPIVNPAKDAQVKNEVKNICPTDIGGKDWQPSAFSPRTGLMYVPVFNICMDLTNHKVAYIPGTEYDGMQITRHAQGHDGNWGAFIAWNPVTGQRVWAIPEKFMVMSGAVVTAGDVVFYGTVDGWFRAVDARTGDVLWSQKLGSGIIAAPITFLGPDNRQYVAVYAAVGGAAEVMHSHPGFPARGSTLYVFSIDGKSISSADKKLVLQPTGTTAENPETTSGRR